MKNASVVQNHLVTDVFNLVFDFHPNMVYNPVFDTKKDVEASQPQYLCGLRGFLKFHSCTLRISFFCLCTNIFHFFDRNDFFRSIKAKYIM